MIVSDKINKPSYLEILVRYFPNVNAYLKGDDLYNNIVWDNSNDPSIPTKETLDGLGLKTAMEKAIFQLAAESNELVESAISIHTESSNNLQQVIYDNKYKEAVRYVELLEQAVEDASAITASEINVAQSSVTVPSIIKKECEATGEPPIILASYIVDNYNNANQDVYSFIGQLEGIRRIAKQNILATNNVPELLNLDWPVWPKFETTISSSVDEL